MACAYILLKLYAVPLSGFVSDLCLYRMERSGEYSALVKQSSHQQKLRSEKRENVCVRERERERGMKSEIDRQTDSERERET